MTALSSPPTGFSSQAVRRRESGGVPVAIPDEIRYPKEEVYEICAALAMAESLLARFGRKEEAAHLAVIFELTERRLVSFPIETGG